MAATTVGEIGERAAIDRIRGRTPPPAPFVVLGIGDDAAVLAPDRNRLDVVTTDVLVEDVHFDRRYVPARAIGYKALAVNLSDLAAMGARPRAATLSLGLPASLPVSDLDDLVSGLLALATASGVALVGGNIARSPGPLFVDVTALGSVHPRRVLTRGGARRGDEIYVSGTVGAAGAGLARAAAGDAPEGEPPEVAAVLDACRRRFLEPEPRLRLGLLAGRTRAASACVDLSDGLADAVRQVSEASGLGAVIDADQVPVDPGAARWFTRAGQDPLDAALAAGEDYELLLTVPGRRRRAFIAAARLSTIPVTRIGVMTAGRRVLLRRNGREEEIPGGFAHFR